MRTLSIIATLCLVVFLTRIASKGITQNETVSEQLDYVNGGPRFKALNKTFTYTYTTNKNQEIILLFDSTNISKGDNYKFVEFLQMIPLLPTRYTFDVKINTKKKLRGGAVYKNFYIYNFRVKYESRNM